MMNKKVVRKFSLLSTMRFIQEKLNFMLQLLPEEFIINVTCISAVKSNLSILRMYVKRYSGKYKIISINAPVLSLDLVDQFMLLDYIRNRLLTQDMCYLSNMVSYSSCCSTHNYNFTCLRFTYFLETKVCCISESYKSKFIYRILQD